MIHPPAESLSAFGLGCLSDADSAAIERHLADCAECRAAVETVPDDAVVQLVRNTLPRTEARSQTATHTTYRDLRFHARGGLGEVSLAWDESLGRDVALKRLHRTGADNPDRQRRFLREAAVTGRLEHPGIVPVYGLGEDADGHPCYAMRFIRGETLRDAIRAYHLNPTKPAFAFRQLLGRFVAVCSAVAYAHSREVIHRDIKPANIVIGPFGETILLDWGLAGEGRSAEHGPRNVAPDERQAGSDSAVTLPHVAATETGTVLGTPGYMAPEQAAGDRVGPAADVYGLGATLYTLLTDRVPPELGSQPSPALLAAARKAMATYPADRYASAQELAADVEKWLADEPVSAYPDPLLVRARRLVRRHQTVAAVGVALLLVTTVALAIGTTLIAAAERKTAKALDDRTQALDEKTAALTEATENFALAREAVDRYSTRVGEERAFNRPGLEGLRAELLADARDFYDRLAARPSADPATEAERALAYSRLTSILSATDSPDKAAEMGRQAIARLEPLAQAQSGRADLRRALRQLHVDEANYHARQFRIDTAVAAGDRAYQLADDLTRQNPTNLDDQRYFAMISLNQAILRAATGKVPEARPFFATAIAIARELATANRSDYRPVRIEMQALVAEGRADRFAKDPQAAEAKARAALAASDELARRIPPDPDDRNARARVDLFLAELLAARKAMPEAVVALGRATTVWEELVRDFPRTLPYAADRASAPALLADWHLEAKRPGDAVRVWERIVATVGPVADRHADRLDLSFAVSSAYMNLASTALQSGDAAAALGWADKWLPVAERPVLVKTRRVSLSDAHLVRAKALSVLNRPSESVAAWTKTIELAPAANRPGYRALRARELVAAKEVPAALVAADELAQEQELSGAVLFTLARVYAAAGQSERAIQVLKRAEATGYFKTAPGAEELRMNADLNRVRSQPGFPKS